MSKKFVTVFAVVAMLAAIVSTNAFAGTMEVGAKGGLNIAKITGDDTDGIETLLGFLAGGYFGMTFNENLGGRIEVLYARKGAKDSYEDDFGSGPVTVEEKVKLDYVEIPIVAVGMFPATETFTFSVFAGPVLAFLAKAEVEGEAAGMSATVDIKDYIKSFEFGGTVGVGGNYMLESMCIFAEARATFGFTNINEDLVDDPDTPSIDESTLDTPSNKNLAFGILAGIGVPLSK